jgi:hypothetical protein
MKNILLNNCDKKLLFLHIPKTAGTAVDNELTKLLPNIYKNLGHVVTAPIEAPWIKRAFSDRLLLESLENNSIIFTVVRNPYDLLVSKYIYGIPYTNPHHLFMSRRRQDWNINSPFTSFRDFIESICNSKYPWIFPAEQKTLYAQLFDKSGSLVPKYIIKQELLDEGINTMLRKEFGKNYSFKSNFKRKTKDKLNYECYYDQTLVNKVKEFYEGELRCFGYGFGNHDSNAIMENPIIKFDWQNGVYKFLDKFIQIPDKEVGSHSKIADYNINYQRTKLLSSFPIQKLVEGLYFKIKLKLQNH